MLFDGDIWDKVNQQNFAESRGAFNKLKHFVRARQKVFKNAAKLVRQRFLLVTLRRDGDAYIKRRSHCVKIMAIIAYCTK